MKSQFKVRHLPRITRGRKPSLFREHESPNQCEGVVTSHHKGNESHRCLNSKMKGSNYCKRHSGTWSGAINNKVRYDALYWKTVAKEFIRQVDLFIPAIEQTTVRAELQSIVQKFKTQLSKEQE